MKDLLEIGKFYHLIWNKNDPDSIGHQIFQVVGDPMLGRTESGEKFTTFHVKKYMDASGSTIQSPHMEFFYHFSSATPDIINSTNIRKAKDSISEISEYEAKHLIIQYLFNLTTRKTYIAFDGKRI